MLNGVAPILIFTFPVLPSGTFSSLSGIPLVGETLAASTALPIPIYMDEKLTGLYIDSESKSIDIATQVDANADGSTPKVQQAPLASTVTINMKALKTSTVLSALIGLIDLAFGKAIAKGYSISYLNGPTTIFGAKIDAFNVSTDADNELMNISLVINQSGKATSAVPSLPVADPVQVGV